MSEHTTGATEGPDTTSGTETAQAEDQPSWAGAMAQIDAEIKELQEMLAKRRIAAASEDHTAGFDDPDSVA
ncbi:MAG: hypothetical protein GEV07_26255 [Streptosporangiales bacterium]|nr:hypothetical protein [Streptosporangiales bacterium]